MRANRPQSHIIDNPCDPFILAAKQRVNEILPAVVSGTALPVIRNNLIDGGNDEG